MSKQAATTGSTTCSATTKAGTPCKRTARKGSKLCTSHRGSKPAPKAKATPKAPAPRTTKATAAELIESGALEIGTKLTANYKGRKVNAKIADADGQVKIGRELHASPSAAAKAVAGNARNGFIFWRLEDGRQLGALRAPDGSVA